MNHFIPRYTAIIGVCVATALPLSVQGGQDVMDIPSVPGATMTNGVPKPYTGGGSGGQAVLG